jgi:diguanylate cyclase (GGDEF)-like protein/PAS domain S-box-containing protein
LAKHTALLARDGHEYQIADSAAPIRNPAGLIVGVVLVFSDVTEAHRVREALASNAEMLERTGEMAKVGGWELDLRSGKFIFSRQALRIDDIELGSDLGITPSVEADFALYAPAERQLIEAAVALATQDGTPWDLELAKRTRKGRAIWVRTQGSAVIGADGRVIKLRGAYHDITERKLAEAEMRIAATAFESQEAILVADADWRIMRVNQAFTRMTGYSAEEALGQLPTELIGSGREEPGFYTAVDQALYNYGVWQGEVLSRRKNGEVFPVGLNISAVKGPDGEVTHFVSGMTDITQRKASEEQIQSLAYYDPLTQLPNRRLLMNRLEKALVVALRYQRRGALLFVDLDNFKTLNDTLGHEQGDFLLEQVAQRLIHCTREGDTVARLGGDEFVVMLENLSEDSLVAATQAEAVGEKILAALNQRYALASYEQHSTPSIGITLFGEQPEGIAEPLKRADLAMYQAKAAGKNMLRFFDPQMQAVVTARAALEVGLRDGLALGQFLLHYQAQVSGQGVVTGAEALLRWPRPPFGLVPPGEFIPLAEDTGLILPLGLWVLETACRQLADWSVRSELAQLTLSVNVSARQFHQADFVSQVLTALARSGANPQRLKLELTEGVLVANVEDVIQKMTALKSAGVGFSLDDFGTGYSSLSYLKRLPLDQLKIDQAFVRDILVDPNDAAIARMVIVLAESLGLAVIAEGVETEAQRAFLAAQGCHAYQGYLFSRPLPLAGFEALVLNS